MIMKKFIVGALGCALIIWLWSVWIEDPKLFNTIYTDRIDQILTGIAIIVTHLIYIVFMIMTWVSFSQLNAKVMAGEASLPEYWLSRILNAIKIYQLFILVSGVVIVVSSCQAYDMIAGEHPCGWFYKNQTIVKKTFDCNAYLSHKYGK